MVQKKAGLACSVCGQRNYSMTPTEKGKSTRLAIKKFCKFCSQHTVHKETK